MLTLSAAALLENLSDSERRFLVVDVRTPSEWAEYSLPKDERIEYVEMNTIPSHFSKFPKDIPLYILCRSGNRSGMVTSFLESQGFKNVYNVLGGVQQIQFLKMMK